MEEPSDSPTTLEDLSGGSEDTWTPERVRIHKWLQHNAPALAPLYPAAVLMATDLRFPGRVHFVAHSVREIRNRLQDSLVGESVNSRTELGPLVDNLVARWQAENLPVEWAAPVDSTGGVPASGVTKHEVSAELLRAAGAIVAGDQKVKDNNRTRTRRMFETMGPDPPLFVVQRWMDGTRWAHRKAHVAATPTTQEDEDRLIDRFREFEETLLVFANRSYENMEVLDDILDAANRPADSTAPDISKPPGE